MFFCVSFCVCYSVSAVRVFMFVCICVFYSYRLWRIKEVFIPAVSAYFYFKVDSGVVTTTNRRKGDVILNFCWVVRQIPIQYIIFPYRQNNKLLKWVAIKVTQKFYIWVTYRTGVISPIHLGKLRSPAIRTSNGELEINIKASISNLHIVRSEVNSGG